MEIMFISCKGLLYFQRAVMNYGSCLLCHAPHTPLHRLTVRSTQPHSFSSPPPLSLNPAPLTPTLPHPAMRYPLPCPCTPRTALGRLHLHLPLGEYEQEEHDDVSAAQDVGEGVGGLVGGEVAAGPQAGLLGGGGCRAQDEGQGERHAAYVPYVPYQRTVSPATCPLVMPSVAYRDADPYVPVIRLQVVACGWL